MVDPKKEQTDIVIVGAGMVGCLLALSIIKKSPNVSVLLIDDNDEKTEKGTHPGFDARSIALSAGSCQLLAELGIWSSLHPNAQPIDDIHISDRGHLGIVELENKASPEAFGYVVELQNVGAVLQQQLSLYPQIKRYYNSVLMSVEKQQQAVICRLQDKRIIEAKLCVAADGANSQTNQLLSIINKSFDYECAAIIANVRCNKAHHNRAFERFTEAGPLALLPLSDNRYSLVWSVKNDELDEIMALDESAFVKKLQQAFGYRAGLFMQAGKRDSYPLKLIKADKPITHRAVAIGNAAHCLHPVMGQGFNLGLRDLTTLAMVISESEVIDSIGSYSMLNRYWQARQKDHHRTIDMTDSMVRFFSNTSGAFVVGRTLALQAISLFPTLGEPIVKQAKGQFTLFKQEENS
ncbi:2-octaprenyl-6-methoxyphenyl hydroxylase [Psychromonas sp. psych-6C06]|uniref:2-octaprenyl-6-methoxyphenyl hydroxylase n=1 Tax=Psychromonas sp. psych-6C06 TaxID=2058089 RepID=UPI000C330ACC|nr:2-octaprenyl-6-methoxyphenyl hydroxylase [Psychromonas sp. psych-6C06]PKF62037.1 2-octaprenyl-6-methoxyphenyl hydroxylase [Psychromonas sp. psych-6C06]